jgi:ATPase subunit of ABC transporter with duplicated ATPase domains
LLRALTSRIWVLHDRHMTDFDGNFGEWEVVSSEREHAAAIRAAEEEALRRMQEKKKTTRRDDSVRDERNQVRVAQRRVEELEAEILQLETRTDTLTRELEDPGLYTRADGVQRAVELGAELDRLKPRMERALEQWTTATEALDTLTSGRA